MWIEEACCLKTTQQPLYSLPEGKNKMALTFLNIYNNLLMSFQSNKKQFFFLTFFNNSFVFNFWCEK